jgi:Flp pilus assembly protein TadG
MEMIRIFMAFYARFLAAKRGNVAIIFASMMIPLMVLTGGAIDYGMAIKTKSQLSTTLDAAMLAAMLQYSNDHDVDYEQIIIDYIDQNFTQSDSRLQGSEITVSAPQISESGEMTATITATVPTNFLKFAHFDQFEVVVTSGVMVGGSSIEVALVLDNTGSMRGGKISSLKKSAKNLVEAIMIEDGSDMVKMAVIPFADYVNIGMENRGEIGLDIPDDYRHSWKEKKEKKCKNKNKKKKCYKKVKMHADYAWYGCMGSRQHEDDDEDTPGEEYDELGVPGLMTTSNTCGHVEALTRLTNSKSEVLAALDDMNSDGWTYIPSGLAWGWRSITDYYPFADGVAHSDKSVKKAIVLMTDGANTRSMKKVTGNEVLHHEGDVYDHTSSSSSKANTLTAQLCESIKASGITIYSIAFDVRSGSSVQSLMRRCAGNGGEYFDADNNTELADAFRKIGLSLLNLRLSK